MGFWSKLGKIGLAVAPYVAAPFTGGASLLATGATNKVLQNWNAKDAQKNAAKGLGPSKFDKYLGMGSNIAGMASSMGAFNKLGGGGKNGPEGLGGLFGGGGDGDSDSRGIGGGNIMDLVGKFLDRPQQAPSGNLGTSAGMYPGVMNATGGGGGLGPSNNFAQLLAGQSQQRMSQIPSMTYEPHQAQPYQPPPQPYQVRKPFQY